MTRCEHVTVKFQQRELETASDWDTLVPGTTAEYAWDEPMSAHRLRVVLESATEAFRDAAVQEYNLDDIKVHKPSHLHVVTACIHAVCTHARSWIRCVLLVLCSISVKHVLRQVK